ncbi:MAG TPA: ABC transporter permease subunit [Candidatus Binatia bacterium]|nr:ABC transporter permease subunit [Candidatus Binatia bacterium]
MASFDFIVATPRPHAEELDRGTRARRQRRRKLLIDLALLVPGAGFLLLAMILPLGQLILASFGLFGLGAAGHFTLDNYIAVAGNVLFTSAFRFSLQIAVATTLLSLVVATATAAVLQLDFPGRRLVGALYKIPLVVPSLIAAFLVLTMVGPGGMVARVLQPYGIRWPSLLHDPSGAGIIVVLLWHNVPITILIVSAVAAAIPRPVIDAARTLGAGPVRVFTRVIVPLCSPGISAAALLVFIDAFGTYAIPSLIGPAFPRALSVTMTSEFLLHARWGTASALGVAMILMTGMVLALYHALQARSRLLSGAVA